MFRFRSSEVIEAVVDDFIVAVHHDCGAVDSLSDRTCDFAEGDCESKVSNEGMLVGITLRIAMFGR